MHKRFFIFSLSVVFLGLLAASTSAQIDASTPSGRPRKEEPLPKNVLESMKKGEIERLKKDYEEMLANGEEAVKLSEEVELSFQKSNKLSSADIAKLEKIEKLLKKIRKDLGGGDDEKEAETEKPSTISNALSTLKESAAGLYDELKKTSRYSISVVAIQGSNSLINIVRYIRFWKK